LRGQLENGDRGSDCDGEYIGCVGVIMMMVRAIVFYADGNVGCGCGGGAAKKWVLIAVAPLIAQAAISR
jgi:hypothetical protein